MVTQLVKVCDVYEALTAARPYKPPMSPAKAFRVMLDMKGQFDASCSPTSSARSGSSRPGPRCGSTTTRRRASSGRPDDFHRPVVEVLTRADGETVDPGARRPYDLSRPEPDGPTMAVGAVVVPTAVPALA